MITVFTPTYNRKELLRRCYDSLKRQTVKRFEWLIVDDGSTDGTKEYIKEIADEAGFPIKYIYQENGGKHRAFNRAVKECANEFMLILDSDDLLTMNAIEILEKKCDFIRNKKWISGIVGNRGLIHGDGVVGTKMPNIKVASGLELYQKMGFCGDTLRLYKVSILRKYPFPEIEGEIFMPENVIFDKIDTRYKMLILCEVLYLCEYQDDGLSKNIGKVCVNNPLGYYLSLKSMAETSLSLKKKIAMTTLCIMWARRFHIKNTFKGISNRIVYLFCIPSSFLLQLVKRPVFYYNMFKEENE